MTLKPLDMAVPPSNFIYKNRLHAGFGLRATVVVRLSELKPLQRFLKGLRVHPQLSWSCSAWPSSSSAPFTPPTPSFILIFRHTKLIPAIGLRTRIFLPDLSMARPQFWITPDDYLKPSISTFSGLINTYHHQKIPYLLTWFILDGGQYLFTY